MSSGRKNERGPGGNIGAWKSRMHVGYGPGDPPWCPPFLFVSTEVFERGEGICVEEDGHLFVAIDGRMDGRSTRLYLCVVYHQRKQTRVKTVCNYSNQFKQQFKHKTHKRKMASHFNRISHRNNPNNRKKSKNCSSGGARETSTTWRLPGSTDHPRFYLPASCTHAYSSYEQLNYHISWSRFCQHSRIQELGSQIARLSVSPHSVGWAPVLFWRGLAEGNWVHYKCRNDGSKCADRYFRLVDMRDKGTMQEGMARTCFQSI